MFGVPDQRGEVGRIGDPVALAVQQRANKLTGPILEVRGRLDAARTIDAAESTQIAVQNGRLDRIEEWLSRVERRLDLAPAYGRGEAEAIAGESMAAPIP